MSDYKDAEEILDLYTRQTEGQITDLNNTIVALRTKVAYLEKQLEEAQRIPVPKSVIRQIAEMEQQMRKMKSDLDYYMPHVPKQVIINRMNKNNKPSRRGGIPKG
jgi:SMC interacting uncharacterized protein involved in chromosome segregation